MRFFFDQYTSYKEKFLDAKRNGNLEEAKHNLLKASEYMFKLASKTEGTLKQSRIENAWKLLNLAKTLEIKGSFKDKKIAQPISETKAESQAKKWILIKKPNIYFGDVAGLEEVKEIIKKRVIFPFQHPEITQRYKKVKGGGVLLFGPPGTGKTMMAKAIATELDAVFFNIKCSDIMSKWVGEAEKNLAELFQQSKSHPRSVIFLDETEAIVGKRGGDSTIMNRVIPEFLSQIDGMDSRENCLLVLGATNRPWDMDEAALRTGRFGEVIYVGLPDLDARRKIVEMSLEDIPMSEDIDIWDMAKRLEGYSGADIKGFCQSATDFPYDREIKSGQKSSLMHDDIEKAFSKRKPSVTKGMLTKYNKFLAKYSL